MTGIFFSTEEEARTFLRQYERGRFDGIVDGEAQHDNRILVSLIGTGKIKATLRTERLLTSYSIDRILHVGTCTSLSSEFKIGTVVAASHVFEGDRIELAAPTYPRLPLELPHLDVDSGALVTQDHAIESESEISYWQRIADMVDMSGYAVAYVAATHGVPCNIVKVVSSCALTDNHDLQNTLARAYRSIADFLIKEIAEVESQAETT